MPIVKSASDLQRNINSIYEVCHESKEPVYITRNGETSLVVMDAKAFEETLNLQQRTYAREMRTYEALMESQREVENGEVEDFEDVRRTHTARP